MKDLILRRECRSAIVRVFVLLMAGLFVMAFTGAASVFAASSISISGDSAVNKGDTFTVKVTFSGDDIGRVDGQMTYDNSVISYISGGSSSGDNGYIQLSDAGTGEALTFNLKFKAVGSGSSNLNVSTNGIYNLEEEYVDAPSAAKSITVNGSEETTEETTEESEVVTEPTDDESESLEIPSDMTEEAGDSSLMKILPFIVMAILIVAIVAVAAAIRKRSRRNRRR